LPIKIGDKTFGKFKDAEKSIAQSKPGIEDPAAYVASIENKQESGGQINGVPKEVYELDPRGPGPVEDLGTRDEQGQSNIINYMNDEPLLFGLGQNSSHEYPGKIVINNESRYVDREVKREHIPNVAATGKYSVGHDTTQPTLPTGAPYELQEIDHNAHGLNFNNKIDWQQQENPVQYEMQDAIYDLDEAVSIPASLAARSVAHQPEKKKKKETMDGVNDCTNCKRKSNEELASEYSYKEVKDALIKDDIKNMIQRCVDVTR